MLWVFLIVRFIKGGNQGGAARNISWRCCQRSWQEVKNSFVQDLPHLPWPVVERWAELDASDKEVFEAQAEEAKIRCT